MAYCRDVIPPIYKRADYLQTSGYNARIDTGVPGDDNTLEFDFDFATITRQEYGAAFGNYNGENERCWRLINPAGTGDSVYYSLAALNRRAGASQSFQCVPTGESIIGKRINFKISYGHVEIQFGEYTNSVDISADTTETISAKNIGIGSPSPTHSGSTLVGKFWYFKIWQGGALVRHYIPCVRLSDSKAGFYDAVNHTFNPSIGSADFAAGFDA